MFRLYHAGDLEAARDLVERHSDRFPERRGHVVFWRMCLHSRVGNPERTLMLFREALADGLWYAADMLADPDLDPARQLPGFGDLAEESAARAIASAETDPNPIVLHPEHDAGITLAVLHGMDGNPADTAADWEPARARGCVVASLQATIQYAPGVFAWDLDRGPEAALAQLESLETGRMLVLGGFSQGAGLASHLAWTGRVDAGGLVLVAPTLRFWGMPIAVGNTRPVPAYLVAGDADQRIGELREFRDHCDRSGLPVHLEEHGGLGHDYPEDFEGVIERALAWIAQLARRFHSGGGAGRAPCRPPGPPTTPR